MTAKISMKSRGVAILVAAGVALSCGAPSFAQTTDQTKVSTGTDVKDGVATTKTTMTRTHKRKTRRPKKILGVKVGHETAVSKTTKTTKTSTNGDSTTTVTTTHP